jgi:hypothetical protein
VIPVATTLTFTQGSPTYDYAGGPVPPDKGTIALRDGVVRIWLWPINFSCLPATIARTPEGIVVEFSFPLYGGGPTDFRGAPDHRLLTLRGAFSLYERGPTDFRVFYSPVR